MAIKNSKEKNAKKSALSAEDLEQYGVWVKAGPETVKEASFAKDDFGLSDLSDVSTEITDEEESLLGSLEEKNRQDGEDLTTDFLGDMDDFSFDSPAEPAGDDDFSFPDMEDIQGSGAGETAEEDGGESAGDDEFSMPEEESLDASAGGDSLDLDFSMDAPSEEESEGFDDIAAVEQEMTDSGPQPTGEEISIDLDIPEEEPETEPQAAAGGFDFDMPAEEPEPEPPAAAASMRVFSKIEQELASIKAELSELKKELSGLRIAGSAHEEGAEAHHKAAAESGFFTDDEDEDETIALTGDELDNILSTADITEEVGESDVPDDIMNFTMEEEAGDGAAAAETEEPSLDLDMEVSAETSGTEGLDFEEAEEASFPGKGFDLSAIDAQAPDDLDITLSSMEEESGGDDDFSTEDIPSEDISSEDISSADETPGIAETIPLTTPEEQAIIEEYNRELDNFGSEELPKEISETIGGEEIPATEEDDEVEFDLDSLKEDGEQTIEESAEEEEAPVFEEDLDEIEVPAKAPAPVPRPKAEAALSTHDGLGMSSSVRDEIKSVLKYMDQLLESLPEDKIQEFAQSEHFDVYRKLFEDLGLE
ncbi:MAG: hypothetical protein FWG35_06210 [Spirochaetaceae bacterium]|nr:hypothetical protein [Spirochaetaceae bacterium]